MVAHALKRQAISEFKACLVYSMSSRTARTQKPCLKPQRDGSRLSLPYDVSVFHGVYHPLNSYNVLCMFSIVFPHLCQHQEAKIFGLLTNITKLLEWLVFGT